MQVEAAEDKHGTTHTMGSNSSYLCIGLGWHCFQVNTEGSGETDAGVAFLNAFNYITSVKDEPYEALSFITDVYNKVRVVLVLLLDCGYFKPFCLS